MLKASCYRCCQSAYRLLADRGLNKCAIKSITPADRFAQIRYLIYKGDVAKAEQEFLEALADAKRFNDLCENGGGTRIIAVPETTCQEGPVLINLKASGSKLGVL